MKARSTWTGTDGEDLSSEGKLKEDSDSAECQSKHLSSASFHHFGTFG